MSFDPKVDMILQYMTNFFASAYPIVGIAIGILLGGLLLTMLVRVIWPNR